MAGAAHHRSRAGPARPASLTGSSRLPGFGSDRPVGSGRGRCGLAVRRRLLHARTGSGHRWLRHGERGGTSGHTHHLVAPPHRPARCARDRRTGRAARRLAVTGGERDIQPGPCAPGGFQGGTIGNGLAVGIGGGRPDIRGSFGIVGARPDIRGAIDIAESQPDIRGSIDLLDARPDVRGLEPGHLGPRTGGGGGRRGW